MNISFENKNSGMAGHAIAARLRLVRAFKLEQGWSQAYFIALLRAFAMICSCP